MFGLRRNQDEVSIDWPSLHSLLEDDDQRAVIKRLYPTEGRESFLTALRRICNESALDILAAGRQLHAAAKLVGYPTLAIAGMLNSGKTSLVATFLSEQGRARTLRGSSNEQGTHRFVLWLPSAWQEDPELWGLLMSDLGDAIGKPPEMLADDPAEAHQQYNNRAGQSGSLSVPLVATDPGLDAAGIGLLDCPDIVSDEAFGLGSPAARRELLGRAATFCSAFIVVSSAESSRDSTLGDLLRIAADLMPGIPRMLAVNKVRPRQTPDQVLETFGPLARGHGIETVFAAYDFDVPGSRPFIPASEEIVNAALDPESDSLPVFFSVSKDPDDNPPASISEDRLLMELPKRLDRSEASDKFILARQHSLRTYVWDNGFAKVDRDADRSIAATQKARECLLQASLEFFAHREAGGRVLELRLHQSERIVRQLSESFALTAPWYARLGVRMNTAVQRFFGGAGDIIRQLTPSAIAKRTAGEIKDKFRKGEYGGLLTPERLQSAIDRHGGPHALPHWFSNKAQVLDSVQWNESAEAAITRYERDDFTSLDPKRLDEAVRQMWAEIPMHKKLTAGLTPLAAMLAAFGGVLMIPLDFGSTVIASASIPELFAALGLTTLSTMWAGGQNTRHVGQQAARQQLSDFHAVLCDTYGVSRADSPLVVDVAGSKETLPQSQIVRREPIGPTLSVYRVRDEFRQELQRLVPRSGPNGT
ncbi:MAG: hypothetical protein HKN47_13360 [Pirellulaceae bacterium]|nr:hypothetical protein [Pirellulaceae bacterium]